MSARTRENFRVAGCLAAALCVFFRDLIFQGRGFYYGDYRQQHYPWALELSRSLKDWTLPFWTDKIGCGFPLLAEGQVGALQPLKWFLYGVLPADLGYSLGFIILFFIAGWFMHVFIRRCGGSWTAGVTAGLVYCYGSAYAGLAWGGSSVWVLAWLPWLMDRTEALCARPGSRNAAKLALVGTLLWLGGFPQMALYASGFALGYAVLRRPGVFGWVVAALTLGTVAAAAQLLPTLELAALSARSQTGLEFALQKSLHPANLATLVQPSLGFLGADFYVGILPLALGVLAAARLRKQPAARAMIGMTLVTLFLAFGKWNPLYVWLIDTLHIYALRTPSKWILFSAFGLAVLAGHGWDAWWSEGSSRRGRAAAAFGVLAAVAVVYAMAFVASREFGSAIVDWLERYVRTHVLGRAGHPYSLESYLSRVSDVLTTLVERTRPENYFTMCAAGVGVGVAFWVVAERFVSSKKKLKAFGMALIAADLFLFSFVGTGFLGNRAGREIVASDAVSEYLIGASEGYRTYEFIPDPLDPPRWNANANMIPGYASIGLYTPLAPAVYRDRTLTLGAVDDSTGARAESDRIPAEEAARLGRMNVKYLISRRELKTPGRWSKILQTPDGSVLYQNAEVWPRAYDAAATEAALSSKHVTATESHAGFYRIETNFATAGAVAVSENGMVSSRPLSSGWRATVDGRSARIEPFDGCFMSIPVGSGPHHVELRYVPVMFWVGLGVSLAALLGIGVLIRR